MTLIGAINTIDELKPNTYSHENKIAWLNEIDGIVKKEIIDSYKDRDEHPFDPYTEDDLTKELLISAPYDRIYIAWLEAQIDYTNGEYGKYNNSMAMFENKMAEYERFYNRTHMPIQHNIRYF